MMNDLVLMAGMIVWIEQHPVDPVSSEAAMCRPDRQRSIRDMREASMNMKIANLEQPPFAATLMGCLKEAGWVSFTVLARSEKRTPIRQAVRDAIAYAYELFYNPIAYQAPGYRIGEGDYDNWIAGVKRGLGTGHGHWWNAQVWSESRSPGSTFFTELAETVPGAEQECAALSHAFGAISEMIAKAGDKELTANHQVELLTEAKRSEAAAITAMRKLAESSLAG